MNELLKQLLETPSESGKCQRMQTYLVAHCKSNGWQVQEDKLGNLYITKGKAKTYPCVVAHMDTVHYIREGGIMALELNGLVTGFNTHTMTQTGIGGDDKCGIYAALFCLQNLDHCKALFFVDEEVGCKGSRGCHLEFFKNCRFVLQADRRGEADWVDSISGDPLGSKEFQEAVKPIITEYGYKPTFGMMTDVMALRDRKIGISCANMSAAYYNPHSSNEYVWLAGLDNVCQMMFKIISVLTEPFPFVFERPVYKHVKYTAGNGNHHGHGRHGRDWYSAPGGHDLAYDYKGRLTKGGQDNEYVRWWERQGPDNDPAEKDKKKTSPIVIPISNTVQPLSYDPTKPGSVWDQQEQKTGEQPMDSCDGCSDMYSIDDLHTFPTLSSLKLCSACVQTYSEHLSWKYALQSGSESPDAPVAKDEREVIS